MKQIMSVLVLLCIFTNVLPREATNDFYEDSFAQERTRSRSRFTEGSNDFEQMLNEVITRSKGQQERWDGFKRLIGYANKHEVDASAVECFFKEIDSDYRRRNDKDRTDLIALQDFLCTAMAAPIFVSYRQPLRLMLDKVAYDVRPFALRSGDFVVLEIPARSLFCAAEQRADGVHIFASKPVTRNQVHVDCLFKISSSISNGIIKFGDTVQLEPVYVRYGVYILPPASKLGVTYSDSGRGWRRTDSIAPLTFREGGSNAVTITAALGNVLDGSPVVVEQGLRLVDVASRTQWALRGEQVVAQSGDAASNRVGSCFAMRNIKPEIINLMHKRLIQVNLDTALKQQRFEERVTGVTQVLSCMRTGFDSEQQEELRHALQELYDGRSKAVPSDLRLLERLFSVASTHPELTNCKYMVEKFSNEVSDVISSRAISYGDVVSLVKRDHQGALQVVMDKALTEQGHLAVTIGGTSGGQLLGQQCMMLSSPHRKRGPILYGDEVIATSFFVDDGRDGGLLVYPVIWWVNSLDSGDKKLQRVMASPIKAVQTHNGQEIFIVRPPEDSVRGALVEGDAIQLLGKKSGTVLTFNRERSTGQPNAIFDVRCVDREQLVTLADKRFKEFVMRAENESNLTKRVKMLDSALDLFKGQWLLSAQDDQGKKSTRASKVLYAEIKRLIASDKNLPVLAVQKLLSKAQEAPFSDPAKKLFRRWREELRGSRIAE